MNVQAPWARPFQMPFAAASSPEVIPASAASASAGTVVPAPGQAHLPDEVDALIRQVIAEVLQEKPYEAAAADSWCEAILDGSLKRIASLGRPFKYIATCVVSRQCGSIVDTAATAFWDTLSDSLCCTRQGNGLVDCIVTVYACKR
mmetsp:Transcript_10140/g.22833  ORF Transcript_10140/g.22833 Transcript_10140/m.22833 type:complete len:146 (-) Transcript_10140:125-562(-)